MKGCLVDESFTDQATLFCKDDKVCDCDAWISMGLTGVKEEDSVDAMVILLQNCFYFIKISAEGFLNLAEREVLHQTL